MNSTDVTCCFIPVGEQSKSLFCREQVETSEWQLGELIPVLVFLVMYAFISLLLCCVSFWALDCAQTLLCRLLMRLVPRSCRDACYGNWAPGWKFLMQSCKGESTVMPPVVLKPSVPPSPNSHTKPYRFLSKERVSE